MPESGERLFSGYQTHSQGGTIPSRQIVFVFHLCSVEWQSWHRVIRFSSVSSPERVCLFVFYLANYFFHVA
jgi:hypothetical protein